jgi:hypothetical protein
VGLGVSDAGAIRRCLIEAGHVADGASTGECLVALNAIGGAEIVKLQCALAESEMRNAKLV